MNIRMLGLCLLLVTLTACQTTPLVPVSQIVTPVESITADSCKAMLKKYIKTIEANPEKYTEDNISAYPEMVQYGQDLAKCQEKGFLKPHDMMQVAEKIEAEHEGEMPEAPAEETAEQ